MEPLIVATGQKSWENRHLTFKEDIDDLYDIWNDENPDLLAVYNSTTEGIQELLKQAIADGKSLRSLGGGWSFTKIATANNGRMVNTKNLCALFNISAGQVHGNYAGESNKLLFSQCGNSVLQLNKYLKTKGRSLKTTGASNGQTIAGALSTGTHGSAIDFGSIPEYVVALHIILSPTRHVWLERSSYPVMADAFPQRLNAELLRDDDLFNAALVGFGSMGFIHGVLLETESLYLLECHRQALPVDAKFLALMDTLDFNTYPSLPHGHERPFHFQVLINPYEKDGNAYVTTMYKRPYRADYNPPQVNSAGIGPGDDAPAFLGLLSESAAVMVPLLVNKLIGSTYKPYKDVFGISGEIFSNTDTRGKVLSASIGIAMADTSKVFEVMNQINKDHGPFAGVFAFRYVKSTKATLGFTRFSPITCVIELDGVMSNASYQLYDKLWDLLELKGIPFTFHWGKICTITPARMAYMYGSKIDQWKAARNTLLPDPAVRKAFTNPQIEAWGLGDDLLV